MKKKPVADSILLEAQTITHGPRAKEYGHPTVNFARIALISSVATGILLSPRDIVKIMQATKQARQQQVIQRDNSVDLAGYAWVEYELGDMADLRGAELTQWLEDNNTLASPVSNLE